MSTNCINNNLATWPKEFMCFSQFQEKINHFIVFINNTWYAKSLLCKEFAMQGVCYARSLLCEEFVTQGVCYAMGFGYTISLLLNW